MQGHVALELDCADLKCSRWDEDRAAAIACAGVDCRLKRSSVECDAVALGSEVTNVIDTSTQIVSRGSMCGGVGAQRGVTHRSEDGCGGECARGVTCQRIKTGPAAALD